MNPVSRTDSSKLPASVGRNTLHSSWEALHCQQNAANKASRTTLTYRWGRKHWPVTREAGACKRAIHLSTVRSPVWDKRSSTTGRRYIVLIREHCKVEPSVGIDSLQMATSWEYSVLNIWIVHIDRTKVKWTLCMDRHRGLNYFS